MQQPVEVTPIAIEVVKVAVESTPVEAVKAAPVEAEAVKAAPVEVVKAPAPVEAPVIPAIPKIVNEVFEALTKDEKFLAAVKVSVDKILHDGKVDQSDIPELVFILSETMNNLSSFHLTIDLIPVAIKMVYKFIVDKYNLVPEDKKADFERIVDSSLRLLMFQPKIRSGLTACFAFLSCKH